MHHLTRFTRKSAELISLNCAICIAFLLMTGAAAQLFSSTYDGPAEIASRVCAKRACQHAFARKDLDGFCRGKRADGNQ